MTAEILLGVGLVLAFGAALLAWACIRAAKDSEPGDL